MKYKAIYDAESDIPNDVKAFYVMKDGKWQFEGSEFEGLSELLNPGLATNKDTILEEKRQVQAKLDASETKVTELTTELAKTKKPDSIVMDAAEQKLFNEYKALGPIKDITEKIENEAKISVKLKSYETEKEVRDLAKRLGLNEDALVDFKVNSERGREVVLSVGKVKEKDKSGKETEREVPMVVITDTVNGKETKTEKQFSEYATENNYPKYLVDAIFSSNGDSNGKSSAQPTKNMHVPSSMLTRTTHENAPTGILSKKIDQFNESRSTRKLPWSAPKETENK